MAMSSLLRNRHNCNAAPLLIRAVHHPSTLDALPSTFFINKTSSTSIRSSARHHVTFSLSLPLHPNPSPNPTMPDPASNPTTPVPHPNPAQAVTAAAAAAAAAAATTPPQPPTLVLPPDPRATPSLPPQPSPNHPPSSPQPPPSPQTPRPKGGRRAANPHLTDEQRRQERVLKNRESAMKSLQKKKRYTEHLEMRAVALAHRNAELKEKINALLQKLQDMPPHPAPPLPHNIPASRILPAPFPPPDTQPVQTAVHGKPVAAAVNPPVAPPIAPGLPSSSSALPFSPIDDWVPGLSEGFFTTDADTASVLAAPGAANGPGLGATPADDPLFGLGAFSLSEPFFSAESPEGAKIPPAFDLPHMACSQ